MNWLKKRTVKKIISSVLLLLLSIVIIWVGVKTLIKNYNNNFNTEKQIKGRITHIEIIDKPITSSYGNVPFLKVLSIELGNSSKKFYTYKANQDYSDLVKILSKGKEVTIRYIQNERVMLDILELSTSQKVILKFKDYKQKEYTAGIIMVIVGFLIFVFSMLLLKVLKE